MANNSVTPPRETSAVEVSREDRRFQALSEASIALFDIKETSRLLLEVGSVFKPEVPEEIAAVVSMIKERAEAVYKIVGVVL